MLNHGGFKYRENKYQRYVFPKTHMVLFLRRTLLVTNCSLSKDSWFVKLGLSNLLDLITQVIQNSSFTQHLGRKCIFFKYCNIFNWFLLWMLTTFFFTFGTVLHCTVFHFCLYSIILVLAIRYLKLYSLFGMTTKGI